MDSQKAIELLRERIEAAGDGHLPDLQAWRVRTESVLRRALGTKNPLYQEFDKISYSPGIWSSGTPDSYFREVRARGVRRGIGVLEAAILEIEESKPPGERPERAERRGVFLVHGHDSRKHEVARTIHQLTGEAPTLLQEKPDRGQTIIEKFEATAGDHAFAVVVATGDDEGRKAGTEAWNSRARQNVVFEMGYFVGSLGRDRVVVLYDPGVELPSDYDGVLFVPLDGDWRLRLGMEMRAAGLPVDLNRLGGG